MTESHNQALATAKLVYSRCDMENKGTAEHATRAEFIVTLEHVISSISLEEWKATYQDVEPDIQLLLREGIHEMLYGETIIVLESALLQMRMLSGMNANHRMNSTIDRITKLVALLKRKDLLCN